MARIDSTEYPDDYIEIVNEINDFIASLDAVPGEPTPHSFSGGGGVVPGVVVGGPHHNSGSHYSGIGSGSGSYAGVGGSSGYSGGGSSGSSDAGYGGSNSTTASRGPSEFLSPYTGVPLGDSRFSVDSLEHDYEPIENIVVAAPPPTPPRNPTSVLRKHAAAGCSPAPRKMAEGQPKHVKAVHNFKGTNNDEVSGFRFTTFDREVVHVLYTKRGFVKYHVHNHGCFIKLGRFKSVRAGFVKGSLLITAMASPI